MPVLRAFRDGISSTNVHIRTVGILYLFNFLFSLLLILPLAVLVDRAIGHSAVAETLAFRFDLEFLVDFLNGNRAALDSYWVVVGWAAVAYLVLSSFLAGGVIDTLCSPGRSAYFPRFFGGCGKFFPRFLRLIPFTLISLWGIVLINEKLNLLIDRFFDQTVREREAFWTMRAKQLLIVLLLMLLGAVLDTARIQAVLMGSTRMTARFFSSFFFVLLRLPRVLGLYSLLTVLGLACFVPYLFVAHALLPAGSVFLLLLTQQTTVYARMWWRVCVLASQLSLFQGSGEAPSTAAFASVLGKPRREILS